MSPKEFETKEYKKEANRLFIEDEIKNIHGAFIDAINGLLETYTPDESLIIALRARDMIATENIGGMFK